MKGEENYEKRNWKRYNVYGVHWFNAWFYRKNVREISTRDSAESIKAGRDPDPFDDWEYTATKKTIH